MTKPRLRKCVMSFCSAEIPKWLHFCKRCYARVPKHLKHELHEEYRRMKLAGIKHSQEQDAIVRQAMEVIAAKHAAAAEKRRGGDLYRPSAAA